jgi:hypothetical protein
MSVPLRKEEPEFDDEELTTADLAQGKRPATSEDRLANNNNDDRPKPVLASRSTEIAPDVENRPENVRTGTHTDFRSDDFRRDSALSNDLRSGTPEEVGLKEVGAEAHNAGAAAASDTAPLFPNQELEELRTRWSKVQTAFVDEPRSAVQQADGLVAAAMKRLAEVFAEERSKLEQQWDRGDNVSTEDLRIALQRYRTFFQRLLAI